MRADCQQAEGVDASGVSGRKTPCYFEAQVDAQALASVHGSG
jgi:hypothetical protein